IEDDLKRSANAGQLYTLASEASNRLYEDENSVYSALNGIEKTLSRLSAFDDSAEEFIAMINTAAIQCSEAASGLRNYLGSVESDPARQQWLEERVAGLHHVARKHQVPLQELINTADAIKRELDELDSADLTLENLDRQRLEREADYRKIADQLSRSRKKAAKSMSQAISEAMQNLAMSGGVFSVELSERQSSRPSIHGLDDIQFMVSANPGQKPRPLGKVASGGELSRISLAIQLIAAKHQVVETMIFDEVDSGVGGAVAEVVGQYLRQLAGNCQVLCVTHLPQVAAQAHHHFRVSKTTDGTTTQTKLTPLRDEETIDEIARMLGGRKITRQTRSHAKEMLDSAAES
ncbi:MAG: DNA repair protein RecN, partial [Gammaproteobacteria bacterium]|nr:DNA repair protein RecN [Gammaproteobacteria bacterium]